MERTFSPRDIEIFFSEIFAKIDVDEEVYRPVVDGLIETSLRGVDSHGVRLMPHYVRATLAGRINKRPKISFEKTSSGTGIIDADNTYGITAATVAMKKAMELARNNGIGGVTIRNSSHCGAMAIYSNLAAKENMIGLSFTHSDSMVVPYGGKKPFLGTNPICFSAPCREEQPFCLDMATSTVPRNRVLVYLKQGKQLEPGWAVDKNGNGCTDPSKVVGLTPLGGYKGYGLGIMVEIVCSLLTGMNFGPHITKMYGEELDKPRHLGQYMMAIDIKRFEDVETFKDRMQALMDELRAQEPVHQEERVKVSNDPEKEKYQLRIKTGLSIDEFDLNEFGKIADKVGVDKTRFLLSAR